MSRSQWNWFHLIPRTFIFEPFLDLGSLLDPILDHTSPLKDLLVPKRLQKWTLTDYILITRKKNTMLYKNDVITGHHFNMCDYINGSKIQ
jgi:hypothetical protein